MNLPSSLWRNRTRTARLLTCAAVTSVLMTGCASDQTNTSRQAEEVNAGLLGSEQPSASPAIPLVGSDEDASTDSDETTDENSQADQASPEATPSENDSESIKPIESIEPSESTKPSDDRVSSWLANKMRVCVQNTLSDPITLEWDSKMQNGKSEYLEPYQLKKTLGPSAFDCAVSYALFGSEIALLYIEGQKISIENAGVLDFYVRFGRSEGADVTPNAPITFTWPSGITDDRLIEARVTTTGKLGPFDQIQAYPIDIRVSDAR